MAQIQILTLDGEVKDKTKIVKIMPSGAGSYKMQIMTGLNIDTELEISVQDALLIASYFQTDINFDFDYLNLQERKKLSAVTQVIGRIMYKPTKDAADLKERRERFKGIKYDK